MLTRLSCRSVALLVVAGLWLACAPGAGDGADESTSTTAGMCVGGPVTSTSGTGTGVGGLCPDHAQVDACCCFDPYDRLADDHGVVCGQQFLCQEVVFPGEDGLGIEASDCAAALDCALEALSAGKPGTLRWRRRVPYGHESVQLHLVGDGTVLRVGHYFEDLGEMAYPVERYELEPADYYRDCAANPSISERVACLQYAPAGAPIESCPDQEDL